MKNASNWFSIPGTDLERAKKFYNAVYGKELEVMDDMPNKEKMLVFPGDMEHGEGTGAVTFGSTRSPSKDGTLVYLNFYEDIQNVVDRVVKAGGTITTPKSPMGEESEYGDYAIMEDTEGNRVGLFSPRM